MVERKQIEVVGTTSVKGNSRTVHLERGQPGRVVMTVCAGAKPIAVVIPIQELRNRLSEIERS
jgi:hypothetical protein